MNKYLLYLLLISGVVFHVSCKKEKLKAAKAAFLTVNTPQINSNIAPGSDSHKITDIWLYVNEQFQGVFPVGNVMPIKETGYAEIMMYGGIKNNGISDTRQPYTFYKAIKFSQNFEPGQTYTYTPVFDYLTSANVRFFDNFQSTGSYFSSVGDSTVGFTVNDPDNTYSGSGRSVFMSMSDAKPTAQIRTSNYYTLPVTGEAIYLELDYKCNQAFTVGVIGGQSDVRDVLVVNPSDSWNKIYVKLTDMVSTPPNYIYYYIYIKASKEVATPQIYLDNIKLVHE